MIPSIEKYYNPLHGLELNPRPKMNFTEDDGRDNENGILFLVEYFFLNRIRIDNGNPSGDCYYTYTELDWSIDIVIRNISVPGYPGLYHRSYGKLKYHEVTGEIVDISHDNITAIACYSKEEREKIIAHGKKYQWRFDNAQPENPRWTRILHPRDIIFLSYLTRKWWAYMFLPFLTVMASWSCATRYAIRPTFYQKIWNLLFKTGLSAPYKDISTSGKCLWFCRLYATRERYWSRITWKICEWVMVKRTGMTFIDAVRLYFVQRGDSGHPIIKLCDLIKQKDKNVILN